MQHLVIATYKRVRRTKGYINPVETTLSKVSHVVRKVARTNLKIAKLGHVAAPPMTKVIGLPHSITTSTRYQCKLSSH